MIAVDSSVWIDHLRGNATPEVGLLSRLIRDDDDILVGDLVLCEVLSGVPSERLAKRIEGNLRAFTVMSMTSPTIAIEAAANYRRLRAKGITLRKTVDVLIGTFCIIEKLPLLHRDRDYDAMEQHLGLRVVHP